MANDIVWIGGVKFDAPKALGKKNPWKNRGYDYEKLVLFLLFEGWKTKEQLATALFEYHSAISEDNRLEKLKEIKKKSEFRFRHHLMEYIARFKYQLGLFLETLEELDIVNVRRSENNIKSYHLNPNFFIEAYKQDIRSKLGAESQYEEEIRHLYQMLFDYEDLILPQQLILICGEDYRKKHEIYVALMDHPTNLYDTICRFFIGILYNGLYHVSGLPKRHGALSADWKWTLPRVFKKRLTEQMSQEIHEIEDEYLGVHKVSRDILFTDVYEHIFDKEVKKFMNAYGKKVDEHTARLFILSLIAAERTELNTAIKMLMYNPLLSPLSMIEK